MSPQHNEFDEEDHWSPPIVIIADDEAIDHSPHRSLHSGGHPHRHAHNDVSPPLVYP